MRVMLFHNNFAISHLAKVLKVIKYLLIFGSVLKTPSVMLDNVSLITDTRVIWPKKGGRVVPGAKSTITQNQMQ